MNFSNLKKYLFPILGLLFVAVFLIYFVGCSNNTSGPTQMTDDQFLQQVVNAGYSNNGSDEDNLMANERYDMSEYCSTGSGQRTSKPYRYSFKVGQKS